MLIMPKMSSGHRSVAACIVDLFTSSRQIVWFMFCSFILGRLPGIHCRGVDEFQSWFICSGEKRNAAACWAVCQIRRVRGLCNQANLKFLTFTSTILWWVLNVDYYLPVKIPYMFVYCYCLSFTALYVYQIRLQDAFKQGVVFQVCASISPLLPKSFIWVQHCGFFCSFGAAVHFISWPCCRLLLLVYSSRCVPSNEPAGSYPAVFSSHVLCLIQHCILAASAVGNGVIKYCI